jgi:arabinogalactan endo-1,4-beta-galactosidase
LHNESLDYFLCYMGVRVNFYSFSEVVNAHQNKCVCCLVWDCLALWHLNPTYQKAKVRSYWIAVSKVYLSYHYISDTYGTFWHSVHSLSSWSTRNTLIFVFGLPSYGHWHGWHRSLRAPLSRIAQSHSHLDT